MQGLLPTVAKWIEKARAEMNTPTMDRKQFVEIMKNMCNKSLACAMWAYSESRERKIPAIWESVQVNSQTLITLIQQWIDDKNADADLIADPERYVRSPRKCLYIQCKRSLEDFIKTMPSGILPKMPFSPFAANLGLCELTMCPTAMSTGEFEKMMHALIRAPLQQGEFLLYWLPKIPKLIMSSIASSINANITDVAIYMTLPLIAKFVLQLKLSSSDEQDPKHAECVDVYNRLLCRALTPPGAVICLIGSVRELKANVGGSARVILEFAVSTLRAVSAARNLRNAQMLCDEGTTANAEEKTAELVEFGVFYELLQEGCSENTIESIFAYVEDQITSMLKSEKKCLQNSGTFVYAINMLLHVIEYLVREKDFVFDSEAPFFKLLADLAVYASAPFSTMYATHFGILVLYKWLQLCSIGNVSKILLVMQSQTPLFDVPDQQKLVGIIVNPTKWHARMVFHVIIYCARRKIFWDARQLCEMFWQSLHSLQCVELACFVIVTGYAQCGENKSEFIGWVKRHSEEFTQLMQMLVGLVKTGRPISLAAKMAARALNIDMPNAVVHEDCDVKLRELIGISAYIEYVRILSEMKL